jgi:hypothetical protein
VQGIDDAVLVMAFRSGRRIVHEERPHGALTARPPAGSGMATIYERSWPSMDERAAMKRREAARGSARLPASTDGIAQPVRRTP